MAMPQSISPSSEPPRANWLTFHKCSCFDLSNTISFEPCPISTLEDLPRSSLQAQLLAAYSNINFLQEEHALTIQGLHNEIEKLQRMYQDHQFKVEMKDIIFDEDIYKKKIDFLEKEFKDLKEQNDTLSRKLEENNKIIGILNHKQKLTKWHYDQELEKRDKNVINLENELEVKCSLLAEITTQLQNKKKTGFFRRFSFNANSDSPPTYPSSFHKVSEYTDNRKPMLKSLKRQQTDGSYSSYGRHQSDETASDLNSFSSEHSNNHWKYSDQSSLSSASSICSLNKGRHKKFPLLKLPPVNTTQSPSFNRKLVRHQLRLKEEALKLASNTLSIDRAPPC